MKEDRVKEIVITGGPCAGKTTGLNKIRERLLGLGFRVFIVPEVATMVIPGGIPDIREIAISDPERYVEIQREFLLTQMALCKRFRAIALACGGERSVIIYDRGPMDVMAYVSPEQFHAILEEEHLTLADTRDCFDGVFHLVTAADGAEEFYIIENNEARQDTSEEARALDRATKKVWTGHRHFRVIDNSTDFDEKMKRVLQEISHTLGIPVSLEIERKYLLSTMPDFTCEGLRDAVQISIEQMYLQMPGGEKFRIRKRSQDGSSLYYKTWKKRISSLVREEREVRITPHEYLYLRRFRRQNLGVIQKIRWCFVYNDQCFELDTFKEPEGLVLLEIELTEEHDAVELPPFLDIVREVTEEKEFRNSRIARRITR